MPAKLSKLKRILKKYGVKLNPKRGKGSHGMFVGPDGHGYTLPSCGDVIPNKYIRAVCRTFKVSKEDEAILTSSPQKKNADGETPKVVVSADAPKKAIAPEKPQKAASE